MVFCAFGPIRLRLNSTVGSPKPLTDCEAVRPPAVMTSPDIRPMGTSTAPMAARSNNEKVRAYPARARVPSKSAPGVTVCAASKGFVLPLMDVTISGTAFAPDRVFQ